MGHSRAYRCLSTVWVGFVRTHNSLSHRRVQGRRGDRRSAPESRACQGQWARMDRARPEPLASPSVPVAIVRSAPLPSPPFAARQRVHAGVDGGLTGAADAARRPPPAYYLPDRRPGPGSAPPAAPFLPARARRGTGRVCRSTDVFSYPEPYKPKTSNQR